MILRRFAVLLLVLLAVSTCALAQRADVAFVLGGAFASDTKVQTVGSVIDNVQTGHKVFFAGELGHRLANFQLASVHVELPIAVIPSAPVRLSSTTFAHLTSLFVTPSLKVKLLPQAPFAPFVSTGVGWAHYTDGTIGTGKAAFQLGGGFDIRTPLPLLAFRLEIRDYITGIPNFALVPAVGSTSQNSSHRNNILAGGGIVVRF